MSKKNDDMQEFMQELLKLLAKVSYAAGYFTAKRETCPCDSFEDHTELVEGYTAQKDKLLDKILGYCDGAKTLNAEKGEDS